LTRPLQRAASADELAERLLSGDRLALSRLITAVEAGRTDARQAMRCLYPKTGRANVGWPGRRAGQVDADHAPGGIPRPRQTVGVIAVDPTHQYSGGAVLGDRIRMMELHADAGVFMRSMATRA
jgi:LAO/AO transport system kinase